MEKDFKMVKSVYTSNYDAIKNIMGLYGIERFDLDCTYSKGSFWKDLPSPINKSDIYPVNETVIEASSENLPFEDSSMSSVMYDPPFVIVGSGMGHRNNKSGSSIIAKRFEGYGTFEDLTENYYKSLNELYRVTKKGGFVVMKCQDTVSGGKQHFSHVMVMNMALEIGFYPRDLFILTSNVRVNAFNGTKWAKQHHARKYHSYFWVFEKVKPKVSYRHTRQEKTI
jgi:DNA modification methylase